MKELNYESIYQQNPIREQVSKKLIEEFSEEVEEYHKDFVMTIQKLRVKAKELKLPIRLRPQIEVNELYKNGGSALDFTKVCLLNQMFEESFMGEPDYR